MNQTAFSAKPELGFGMQGMGAHVALIVWDICKRFNCVTYLEIGVGHGITLAAVADLLREYSVKSWRAIGVDLPNGYSLNTGEVSRVMLSKNLRYERGTEFVEPNWGRVTLYLADSQVFLRDVWQEELHLVLIDGCHGKPCAMNDFLNVEDKVQQGGIVLFHDFGQDQVGQPQPHCATGLDVRGACRTLGLMDNQRPGWHFVRTIIGNKAAGSGDMGVFEKL